MIVPTRNNTYLRYLIGREIIKKDELRYSQSIPGMQNYRYPFERLNQKRLFIVLPGKGSETSHDFTLSSVDGYLQYRLTFISDNGDRYPEVDKVELSVSSD